MPKLSTSRYHLISAALFISLITFWSYYSILGNGFVSYDDVKYLIENDHVSVGLTLNGLRWALTSTYDANWFPVTWLSHMADVSMFGFTPEATTLSACFFTSRTPSCCCGSLPV